MEKKEKSVTKCHSVDGSLDLTVPFMNRLNQTEPATFSILPCWAFFRDSYFHYFTSDKSQRKNTYKHYARLMSKQYMIS
jgi:hypothetical protein